jgi:hypothetical protein
MKKFSEKLFSERNSRGKIKFIIMKMSYFYFYFSIFFTGIKKFHNEYLLLSRIYGIFAIKLIWRAGH